MLGAIRIAQSGNRDSAVTATQLTRPKTRGKPFFLRISMSYVLHCLSANGSRHKEEGGESRGEEEGRAEEGRDAVVDCITSCSDSYS